MPTAEFPLLLTSSARNNVFHAGVCIPDVSLNMLLGYQPRSIHHYGRISLFVSHALTRWPKPNGHFLIITNVSVCDVWKRSLGDVRTSLEIVLNLYVKTAKLKVDILLLAVVKLWFPLIYLTVAMACNNHSKWTLFGILNYQTSTVTRSCATGESLYCTVHMGHVNVF